MIGHNERFEWRIRQTRKNCSITWRAFGVGKFAKDLFRFERCGAIVLAAETMMIFVAIRMAIVEMRPTT